MGAGLAFPAWQPKLLGDLFLFEEITCNPRTSGASAQSLFLWQTLVSGAASRRSRVSEITAVPLNNLQTERVIFQTRVVLDIEATVQPLLDRVGPHDGSGHGVD